MLDKESSYHDIQYVIRCLLVIVSVEDEITYLNNR